MSRFCVRDKGRHVIGAYVKAPDITPPAEDGDQHNQRRGNAPTLPMTETPAAETYYDRKTFPDSRKNSPL